MRLTKGTIVVVAEIDKSLCTVEIDKEVAPVSGRGWLYTTKEGNLLFVEPTGDTKKTVMGMLIPARFIFVVIENKKWVDLEAIVASLPPKKEMGK